MKYLMLAILILPLTAHAIERDVRIPEKVDQRVYVESLIGEKPLPKDIHYTIYDKKLHIVGDGYISAEWTGYTKAEEDYQAEKNATVAVALGVAAVVGGYGLYKKLQA
jgi:hypothetical protein